MSALWANRPNDFPARHLRRVERAACKPSSVLPRGHPRGSDGHSSGRRISAPLERYTRGTRTGPPWFSNARIAAFVEAPTPHSILLQVGFTGPPCHHGAPVSSYLTLSPLPPGPAYARREAVYSLWHFPWGHPRWTLSSTTTLRSSDFPPARIAARERPSGPLALHAGPLATGGVKVNASFRGPGSGPPISHCIWAWEA
jgi:hypothetical protein